MARKPGPKKPEKPAGPRSYDERSAFDMWAGMGEDTRSMMRLSKDLADLGIQRTVQELVEDHDTHGWGKRIAERRARFEAFREAKKTTFEEAVAGRSSLLQAAEEIGDAVRALAVRMQEGALAINVRDTNDLKDIAEVMERSMNAATQTLLNFKQITNAMQADALHPDMKVIDGTALDVSDIVNSLGSAIEARIKGAERE